MPIKPPITGKEILKWRKARDISRARLGELLSDTSASTIKNWEHERSHPPRCMRQALLYLSKNHQVVADGQAPPPPAPPAEGNAQQDDEDIFDF